MIKKIGKPQRKLILACSSAIFSLAVTFTGVYAWFSAQQAATIRASKFEVTATGGAKLKNIELIKFEYGKDPVTGDYDYLNPAEGEVKRYQFNEEEGYFGETIAGVFYKVDVMNVYDPVTKVIQGDSFKLFDMNCSAIYEITFEAKEAKLYSMDAISNRLTSKTPGDGEILLTDCADFDISYEDDLLVDPGTDEDGKPLYYPTYIAKNESLSDDENIFYRLSYKGCEAPTHPHYYVNSGEKPTQITLDEDASIDLRGASDLEFKVYVNVNYADQLMDQYLHVLYSNSIRAVYDFNFEFSYE